MEIGAVIGAVIEFVVLAYETGTTAVAVAVVVGVDAVFDAGVAETSLWSGRSFSYAFNCASLRPEDTTGCCCCCCCDCDGWGCGCGCGCGCRCCCCCP